MAIIGSLFALAGRFAGRVVNALLGWATILLFGRVDARKQTILGFVVMASLAWVGAIVGLLVPDIGTFIVAAIPRPDFISDGLIRLAMLVAVIVIPLAVGATGIWLAPATSRPRGLGLLAGVLRGYPFTALLAFLMAFLAVVAFVRKMNSLRRRWQDAHVPLIVKPGHYDEVVNQLLLVLRRAAVPLEVRAAPSVLSLPPRLLDRVAGRTLGSMVPDHLALLVGEGIEILVYPSDVAISGQEGTVARSRAAIASELTEAPAWLTMSAEAQDIEDRLEAISHLGATPLRERALARIDAELASVMIPYEEWETLYRMRLQLGSPHPAMFASAATAQTSEPTDREQGTRDPTWKRIGRRFGSAVGAAGVMALLATDIAILLSRGNATAPRTQSRPVWPWRRWLRD